MLITHREKKCNSFTRKRRFNQILKPLKTLKEGQEISDSLFFSHIKKKRSLIWKKTEIIPDPIEDKRKTLE